MKSAEKEKPGKIEKEIPQDRRKRRKEKQGKKCIILEISDHLRQVLLRGQVTEDKNSDSWFLQVMVTVTLNNRNKSLI